jgi:hypothetical protein
LLVAIDPIDLEYSDTFSPPTAGGSCAKSPENTILRPPNDRSGVFKTNDN